MVERRFWNNNLPNILIMTHRYNTKSCYNKQQLVFEFTLTVCWKRLCSFPQAWITTVQRCSSTANVSSSTCLSHCPVTTTSRPSPQSCCRHVRSMAPRPWPANRVFRRSIYRQVKSIGLLVILTCFHFLYHKYIHPCLFCSTIWLM